jgi:hypothetical protein
MAHAVRSIINNTIDTLDEPTVSLICETIRRENALSSNERLLVCLSPHIPHVYRNFEWTEFDPMNVARAVLEANPDPASTPDYAFQEYVSSNERFITFVFYQRPAWIPLLPPSHGMYMAFLNSDEMLPFVMDKVRKKEYPLTVLENVPRPFLKEYAGKALSEHIGYSTILETKNGVSELPSDLRVLIGDYTGFIRSTSWLNVLQDLL